MEYTIHNQENLTVYSQKLIHELYFHFLQYCQDNKNLTAYQSALDCLERLDQLLKKSQLLNIEDSEKSNWIFISKNWEVMDPQQERLQLIQRLYSSKIENTEIQKAQKSPGSSAFSYFANIFSNFSSVMKGFPYAVGSLCYDSFIDGNYAWKTIKYQLNLESISRVFFVDHPHQLFEDKTELTNLEEKTLAVIQAFQFPLQITPARMAYQNFIDKLREALSCEEFKEEIERKKDGETYSPCIDYLLDICTYRYAEVHIYSFCEQLITMILMKGIQELYKNQPNQYANFIEVDPFDMPLEIQFQAIHAAPQECKAPYINLFFTLLEGDPQRKSNMPYVLYDVEMQAQDQQTRSIRVIRNGTPTIQNIKGSVTINPEFEYFLLDKKVLFVRLEDEQKRILRDESKRNTAFKELREKYPDNLFLTILAHDTDFYHQAGVFSDTDETTSIFKDPENFKNAFIDEMTNENKVGFYFPPSWLQEEAFLNDLSTIWDEVYEDFFNNKESLDKDERCNFIIAYYIRLTLYLLRKTESSYLIFCCKDSIDRAGTLNAALLLVILILLEKENSKEYLKIVNVFIHAATIIVQKRAMNNRKERLQAFLNLLSSSDVRERLRARKESIGIVDDSFKIKIFPEQYIEAEY